MKAQSSPPTHRAFEANCASTTHNRTGPFPPALEGPANSCANKPHNITETPPLTHEASKKLINNPEIPIDHGSHPPASRYIEIVEDCENIISKQLHQGVLTIIPHLYTRHGDSDIMENDNDNIAIYLDFENLAISADEAYPSKERPLRISPLVDFANSKGNVCLKKAYANWNIRVFRQYQQTLVEAGFELIHLPSTTSRGKNGADVKIAIDAMENMELFKFINVFIIGSGDTDFIPLIQRMRARGKSVILIGFEHSVGTLVKKNCSEYKSIEELIGKPEKDSLSSDLMEEVAISQGRDLLVRYISTAGTDSPVVLTNLKVGLLRLEPSFSERKYGFNSFMDFIRSFMGDIVENIEQVQQGKHLVYFTRKKLSLSKESKMFEDPKSFLQKKIRYISKVTVRKNVISILFNLFRENESISMKNMGDAIYRNTTGVLKIEIRKLINTLFIGNAFHQHEYVEGPLLARPFQLHENITGPEGLEQCYISRVREILKNRFPNLKMKEIERLMNTGS